MPHFSEGAQKRFLLCYKGEMRAAVRMLLYGEIALWNGAKRTNIVHLQGGTADAMPQLARHWCYAVRLQGCTGAPV